MTVRLHSIHRYSKHKPFSISNWCACWFYVFVPACLCIGSILFEFMNFLFSLTIVSTSFLCISCLIQSDKCMVLSSCTMSYLMCCSAWHKFLFVINPFARLLHPRMDDRRKMDGVSPTLVSRQRSPNSKASAPVKVSLHTSSTYHL